MARSDKKALSASAGKYTAERRYMIGPKLNFAAAEAYKLLRTNVMFSFPGGSGSHILGVTSSFRGEGKSLTAINLAYTFAETGRNILLIEGDMRMPTMAGRLALPARPGLSNVLVGAESASDAIRQYRVTAGEREVAFDVMVAGDIPPNPSELLGSVRARTFLQKVRERYDVIILDLPPVTAVTDAIVASRLVDGVIVVVRAGHAVRGGLADTMRQLRLAEAHVLGFVFNGAASGERKYYKKGYYRKGYYASGQYGGGR